MGRIRVVFEYRTGIRGDLFRNARLSGSWDTRGRQSWSAWTTVPMHAFEAGDGCGAWRAEVALDDSECGRTFGWGVVLDGPGGERQWAIPTEGGPGGDGRTRHREFRLERDGQAVRYWLTDCRRLGANRQVRPGGGASGIRFAVFAPYALDVEVVVGDPTSGYVFNDGRGVAKTLRMTRDEGGVWHTFPADPALACFDDWVGACYMYRVTREDGSVRYRTDLWSRCQAGGGRQDPDAPGSAWDGTAADLDGGRSCSVVVDPERVGLVPEEEFWKDEHDPNRPVPGRLADMVIYELHVGALAAGRPGAGTLADAVGMVDHLAELGVNAVELLPMAEFAGTAGWGYGTSHFHAVERSAGGRDALREFVRACHRRGIAVLMDVVYNHYAHDAERAQWQYDSAWHDHNAWYWYEGTPFHYPAGREDGGYLDNGSSGWTPDFRRERVRKALIGSAVALAVECHVDGFRVDLTQAMHRDNRLHLDGREVPEANRMGARFLREWSRTLRMFRPGIVLVAEDHSGWEAVTRPVDAGGLGFDASWRAEWYHHLVGDATTDPGKARLIRQAGLGGDGPLAMGAMAGALGRAAGSVVYHESHDECGNSSHAEAGGEARSGRTVVVAVNGVLDAVTRAWAEARARVAAGLTLLGPGTPLFFMGEEVAADDPQRWNDFIAFREDILGLKAGDGAAMFRFYRDLVRLRLASSALRSGSVEIVHAHDANRVLAFRRCAGGEDLLVVASLCNRPYDRGYVFEHGAIAAGRWTEVLNSDSATYGGWGTCNAAIRTDGGRIAPRVPSNAVIVLRRAD